MKPTEPAYNRIKEVLASKGVTQAWVARQLNKTHRMVNCYANNTVQPPIPVLFEIARLLNVQPKDLLNTLKDAKPQ